MRKRPSSFMPISKPPISVDLVERDAVRDAGEHLPMAEEAPLEAANRAAPAPEPLGREPLSDAREERRLRVHPLDVARQTLLLRHEELRQRPLLPRERVAPLLSAVRRATDVDVEGVALAVDDERMRKGHDGALVHGRLTM